MHWIITTIVPSGLTNLGKPIIGGAPISSFESFLLCMSLRLFTTKVENTEFKEQEGTTAGLASGVARNL